MVTSVRNKISPIIGHAINLLTAAISPRVGKFEMQFIFLESGLIPSPDTMYSKYFI